MILRGHSYGDSYIKNTSTPSVDCRYDIGNTINNNQLGVISLLVYIYSTLCYFLFTSNLFVFRLTPKAVGVDAL
jgi:hypothetical protein